MSEHEKHFVPAADGTRIAVPEFGCPECAAPVPPRPVYSQPANVLEGWDEEHDRAVIDGVGWDLSFECTVHVSHQYAHDTEPAAWTASASLGGQTVVRSVTLEQVRLFARELFALADRVEGQLMCEGDSPVDR